MRVLIVGSTPRQGDEPNPAEVERMRGLASAIGAELALRGHEIAICSTSQSTADYWAVTGANDAATERPAAVSFFVSTQEIDDAAAATYAKERFPRVALSTKLTHSGWFGTYETAVEWSEAVIALGGSARGTGAALYVALARRRPVIGVRTLGGAAADIWKDTADHYKGLPDAVRLALEATDPAQVARASVDAAEELAKRSPFPDRAPVRAYGWFALLSLVLLAGWAAMSFAWQEHPEWKPYVVGLCTALAGMLLRYVGDPARNREAYLGRAELYRDLARVLALLLLASLLIDWAFIQAAEEQIDGTLLRVKLVAVIGFAVGFLVEDMSQLLTRRLTDVVRSRMEQRQ